ncbi:MAG: adenine deaminase [Candidatus Omnitrophota bacterium]
MKKIFLCIFIIFIVFPFCFALEEISGNIVDVLNKEIYSATLIIDNGKIIDIRKDNNSYNTYILPGLIDSHIHIESSLLTPSEFARLAVIHGTVAAVSDPHEIANVLGIPGINYMIDSGNKVPFKFYFGASSCVPATEFETSGARIDSVGIEELLKRDEIIYLSEMMNYPGVINNDPEVLNKIAVAKKYSKPIDGHAPKLRGKDLERYVKAGISTDHETISLDEGLEKISLGMKVIIREGSAAKNFDALHTLIDQYPDMCMFCSDDKHPDDLVKGHINELVVRALKKGYDKWKILQVACVNPVKHYGLGVGLLQKNDPADFIIIDNFDNFNILKTYINGILVSENGRTLIEHINAESVNNFNIRERFISDFEIKRRGKKINIINAIDGQLITHRTKDLVKTTKGFVVSDRDRDILKIAVINRYNEAPVSVAFIKNFGLKQGAIASNFAHDSHNIVAVGVSDKDIADAVNVVIENRGGLSQANSGYIDALELPIAGLMSSDDGFIVAEKYSKLSQTAKDWGSQLRAPYMTLSFMALLVIPDIKLSDKGLFDAKEFKLIDLFDIKS